MKCAYCIYNDGAVYTSVPPQYKCTITNEFHFGLDNCNVEFAPVKHGRWIDMGDFEQCSECHSTHLKEFQTYYGKVVWNKTFYCPNCGARMDLEYEDA